MIPGRDRTVAGAATDGDPLTGHRTAGSIAAARLFVDLDRPDVLECAAGALLLALGRRDRHPAALLPHADRAGRLRARCELHVGLPPGLRELGELEAAAAPLGDVDARVELPHLPLRHVELDALGVAGLVAPDA